MDAMQGLRMVAQLVECLHSMHKALDSVTTTAGSWAEGGGRGSKSHSATVNLIFAHYMLLHQS